MTFFHLEVTHRAFRLNASLLAELHDPAAKLVGHVHRGLLVVHVDHVDVVDVAVAVGERRGRSSEAVALKSQKVSECLYQVWGQYCLDFRVCSLV